MRMRMSVSATDVMCPQSASYSTAAILYIIKNKIDPDAARLYLATAATQACTVAVSFDVDR